MTLACAFLVIPYSGISCICALNKVQAPNTSLCEKRNPNRPCPGRTLSTLYQLAVWHDRVFLPSASLLDRPIIRSKPHRHTYALFLAHRVRRDVRTGAVVWRRLVHTSSPTSCSRRSTCSVASRTRSATSCSDRSTFSFNPCVCSAI